MTNLLAFSRPRALITVAVAAAVTLVLTPLTATIADAGGGKRTAGKGQMMRLGAPRNSGFVSNFQPAVPDPSRGCKFCNAGDARDFFLFLDRVGRGS